jgi:hypothetical protein
MLSLPAEQPNPLRAWWQQCRHHVRPPGRQARDAVVQRIRGLQAGWADLNEEAFALQVQRVRVQLLAQGLQGGAWPRPWQRRARQSGGALAWLCETRSFTPRRPCWPTP